MPKSLSYLQLFFKLFLLLCTHTKAWELLFLISVYHFYFWQLCLFYCPAQSFPHEVLFSTCLLYLLLVGSTQLCKNISGSLSLQWCSMLCDCHSDDSFLVVSLLHSSLDFNWDYSSLPLTHPCWQFPYCPKLLLVLVQICSNIRWWVMEIAQWSGSIKLM